MRLTYETHLPGHTVDEVFAWHERPGALERLTPPWGDVEVVHKEGGIRDGAVVVLRIRQGPASFEWKLRHTDFVEGRQFCDEQVSGPMKSWRHVHRFSSDGGGGSLLEDDIEIEPPLGPAGSALAPGFIEKELDRLFAFRRLRLRHDLMRHASARGRPRMTVAISGASGMIGRALTHFLTTGGHSVIRLVRDRSRLDGTSVYWNPANGEIDAAGLARADAVVHLAGEPIAGGRWTDARKKAIRQSRIQGTDLLSRTLATMTGGPRVLLSMSAVGYYGDRGEERLTEDSRPGKGFLASVAQDWEAATRPAERGGLRVVRLRAGVVLSPAGGALGKMLLPFKMGVGGRLGSGRQYMSWIDLDDVVGMIHHCLVDDRIHGAVNMTSPHPVTNSTFTSILGSVLGRPTVLPVPGLAVKAVFGELGKEALLEGQRVLPARAVDTGYDFAFEGLEDSLRFQLGRSADD
ncbi:MAG: TIGR01777 family oxidoreductase [Longimicrobiales bacterium]